MQRPLCHNQFRETAWLFMSTNTCLWQAAALILVSRTPLAASAGTSLLPVACQHQEAVLRSVVVNSEIGLVSTRLGLMQQCQHLQRSCVHSFMN